MREVQTKLYRHKQIVKKQSELSLNKILKYSKISCMQVSLTTYMECKHSLIKKNCKRLLYQAVFSSEIEQQNVCVYSSICYKKFANTILEVNKSQLLCGESPSWRLSKVNGTIPVQCLVGMRPNKSHCSGSSLKAEKNYVH